MSSEISDSATTELFKVASTEHFGFEDSGSVTRTVTPNITDSDFLDTEPASYKLPDNVGILYKEGRDFCAEIRLDSCTVEVGDVKRASHADGILTVEGTTFNSLCTKLSKLQESNPSLRDVSMVVKFGGFAG